MDDSLLHGIIPEHVWPAVVAAGGLQFLAATLAHAQQWPSLHSACSRAHGFSSLCDGLLGVPAVPGISQVGPSWPASLALHLTKCLLSDSDSDRDSAGGAGAADQGGAGPAVKWAAFTELCACSEYLPHAVAMNTVSGLCAGLRSVPSQCGTALAKLLWCTARRCAACTLEAESCGCFARHFMGAVAACRCALVAAITDESDGAMQHLREQFAPQGSSAPAFLFNPTSCLAVSALLLAVHTHPASAASEGSIQAAAASCLPSQYQLLEDSVAQDLTVHACNVLQWALACAGEQDSPVDTLMHSNMLALLSLVVALAGGWHSASKQNDATRACSRCIPLSIASAMAQLCCTEQQVPEALRATALLLLVVVCTPL